jgi:glycosyltransferase involved in cell wall biosynthesis
MQNIDSTISVVIATLNEEEGIGPTIEEIQQFLTDPYLLIVDGKSVDRTVEIAKNMGADVLLQEGKGKGDAIAQGLKKIDLGKRYVVFTDADYTYPAEFIPKMVEILDQNSDVGMVIGNRFGSEEIINKPMKKSFYMGNRILAFAQSTFNGVKLKDPLSGLRVIRADIARDWAPKSKGFDIEAEMNFIVESKGFNIVEMPIGYRDRLGEKKLKLRHGWEIMKRIMTGPLTT